MKHFIYSVFFIISCTKMSAQDISVEKSIWGVQLGIHPLSVYYEVKLTNSIALRSELGLGFGGSGEQWGIVPTVIVEPRYYFNLKKRAKRGKQIAGNNGNYLSLILSVKPGFGIGSSDVDFYPVISTIPMYGLRRNIGKYFNFETAIGYGYSWEFQTVVLGNGKTKHITEGGTSLGLRVAIGYRF
jgi:hypothetical protein